MFIFSPQIVAQCQCRLLALKLACKAELSDTGPSHYLAFGEGGGGDHACARIYRPAFS
jgi:hypothetical protein